MCGLYFSTATLPDRLFWDHSCYNVSPECFSESRLNVDSFPLEGKSFLHALWKAVAVTRNTAWVLRSEACSDTKVW